MQKAFKKVIYSSRRSDCLKIESIPSRHIVVLNHMRIRRHLQCPPRNVVRISRGNNLTDDYIAAAMWASASQTLRKPVIAAIGFYRSLFWGRGISRKTVLGIRSSRSTIVIRWWSDIIQIAPFLRFPRTATQFASSNERASVSIRR